MKRYILTLTLILAATQAQAQVNVRGYQRQDGQYVMPYQRTAPDNNPYNNYSTPRYQQQPSFQSPQPQYNPYTMNRQSSYGY